MTYTNVFKTVLARIGWKSGLLLVATLAGLAFVLPNVKHIGQADTTCAPTFTQPVFNAYPVSYNHPNGEPCKEFPAIQGRTNTGTFPRSQAEWAAGTTATAGQEVLLQSWVHNSAAPGSGKLFNVKVHFTVDTAKGSSHTVTVRFTADNAAPFSSSYTIHTGPNDRLEFVPGSVVAYDSEGNPVESGMDLGTIDLGNMKACFEFAQFISFRVRVVTDAPTPQIGCIDIIKETFNTQSQPITPVAQFTFRLDGSQPIQNDGNGRARYANVATGTHTVTEDVPGTWTQLSVTPANGTVNVSAGSNCAVVVFKNKQNITYATPYLSPYSTPYSTPYNTPYASPYSTPYISPYATPYSTPYPTPAQFGCVTVIKEAFDTNGNVITPTPQFIFKLDNNQTATNDGSGRVTFQNVSLGQHTVTETLPASWSLVSTTPQDGRVNVTAGSNCATVVFKNKQIVNYTTPYSTPYVTPYVTPTTPNLVFSKKAWNDTQNKDATTVPANREDFVTYTLTVTNTGSAESKNFIITDDLSGVLPFADMISNGGATVSGSTISYPAINIPAGQSVSKTFQVRIKFHLAAHQSFQLINTYGNSIQIMVPGKTIFVAPKTGSDAMSVALFAGLVTSGYVVFRKRKNLMNFIWQ
jgi:uncharacterized repeat protein (TIGR01451 family)/LPXTG-motif cell wall-anchored protein